MQKRGYAKATKKKLGWREWRDTEKQKVTPRSDDGPPGQPANGQTPIFCARCLFFFCVFYPSAKIRLFTFKTPPSSISCPVQASDEKSTFLFLVVIQGSRCAKRNGGIVLIISVLEGQAWGAMTMR